MLPDLLSSTFKRRLGDGTDVNAKEIIDLFADLELATEDLFSSGKLRSSPAPNLPKYPEFSAVFAESFLPLMMDVIQEYELSIIFVHVQSQANANGIVSRSENASQYLGALQQYLASKGATTERLIRWNATWRYLWNAFLDCLSGRPLCPQSPLHEIPKLRIRGLPGCRCWGLLAAGPPITERFFADCKLCFLRLCEPLACSAPCCLHRG